MVEKKKQVSRPGLSSPNIPPLQVGESRKSASKAKKTKPGEGMELN